MSEDMNKEIEEVLGSDDGDSGEEERVGQALPPLPEAPVSLHIDAYFKGFHVGITQRDPSYQEDTNRLIGNAKKTINHLVADGWEPSWNKETNQKHDSDPNWVRGGDDKIDTDAPTCGIHNVLMTLKPAGVSKAGRQYSAFWGCAEKMPDGGWCTFKPDIPIK